MPDVVIDPDSAIVMTGNTGHPEVMITVEDWARKPVQVRCADGTVVEIKPGKSKTLIQWKRDVRFHLLDCVCEACVTARAQKTEEVYP